MQIQSTLTTSSSSVALNLTVGANQSAANAVATSSVATSSSTSVTSGSAIASRAFSTAPESRGIPAALKF